MVPDNWTEIELGDVSKMEKGVTYSAKHYAEKGAGYPFITIKCIQKGGGFNWRGLKYYAGPHKQSQLINSGDLLIAATDLTRNGDIIGSPIRVPIFEESKSILMSMDICRIDSDSRLLVPDFLYYQLMSEKARQFMKANSAGSTVLHLNTKSIPKMKIALPPLPEQKKIAAILSSVDDAIQTTQAVIDQTHRVKQGLLQQLLTRGIGHNRFKQTEIGEVPESWEIVKTEDIANVIRGASPRPKGDSRYYGGEVPRLMVADVTRDRKYVTPSIDFLTDEGAKLSRPMSKGTLTIVCSGTVGIPSILAVDACIHDGFLALSNVDEKIDVEFLYYVFSRLQRVFDSVATHGGVFTNLTTGILKDFIIPKPPIEKQKKIIRKLNSIDSTINLDQYSLDTLLKMKRGLMQDLLTGRVRVKPDEVNTT